MLPPDFDSQQELPDIYFGDRKTDIIHMIETIRDYGWSGPIVTEIPATSEKSLITTSRFASPSTLVKVHGQIVEDIKEILT